jgi:AhpD family alkylhydroperoxidase
MAKIAVEDSLTNVKQALQNSGHEVVSLGASNMQGCDCCVISGQDQNVMGMSNAETSASVINADGMSADQVVEAVNRSIGQ